MRRDTLRYIEMGRDRFETQTRERKRQIETWRNTLRHIQRQKEMRIETL